MNEGQLFLDALQAKAKMMAPRVLENIAKHPADSAWLMDPLARWTQAAYGPEIFELAAKGYARYSMEVSLLQAQYEKSGVFSDSTMEEVSEGVYENPDYMIPYMWAAVLIYAYWPSMVRHIAFYRDRFLQALPAQPKVLELACGHGVLGLLAAEQRPDLHVNGVDISPAAIEIATKLRAVSGHAERVSLEVKDALDLQQAGEAGQYSGIIAAMLAEHLPEPQRLLQTIKHHLAPEGIAFFSTALESAQKDHVSEFSSEGQVVQMAEAASLRVVELLSDGERRPGARYRPRAMALLLEHI